MNPSRLRCLLGLLATAAILSAVRLEAEPEKNDMTRIMEVTDVKLVASKAGQLVIEAGGRVTSGGWTEPALVPAAEAGTRGVYAFDFVARKPSGPATMAIEEIRVVRTLNPKPADLTAVRINAASNSKTASLH